MSAPVVYWPTLTPVADTHGLITPIWQLAFNTLGRLTGHLSGAVFPVRSPIRTAQNRLGAIWLQNLQLLALDLGVRNATLHAGDPDLTTPNGRLTIVWLLALDALVDGLP